MKSKIIELFLEFLRKENIVEIFCVNLSMHPMPYSSCREMKKGLFSYLNQADPCAFIGGAFWWKETSEDYEHWNNIDNKWSRILDPNYIPMI